MDVLLQQKLLHEHPGVTWFPRFRAVTVSSPTTVVQIRFSLLTYFVSMTAMNAGNTRVRIRQYEGMEHLLTGTSWHMREGENTAWQEGEMLPFLHHSLLFGPPTQPTIIPGGLLCPCGSLFQMEFRSLPEDPATFGFWSIEGYASEKQE